VVVVAVIEWSIGHSYGIVGLFSALTVSYLVYCLGFYVFATRELRTEAVGMARRLLART
jgi:hypothetical protein